MTVENRTKELMEAMKAFEREKFYKGELLQELLDLQNEIVNLTFNEIHSENGDLRLYDVERHMKQMNDDQGNLADEELQLFHEGCSVIVNAIRAEISGNRGEYKTMKTLEHLQGKHLILRNTELRSGDLRTELDAIVITQKAVFIVEVKNTGKNIFIDEEGNYYRTGEFLRWDCNIGEKMKLRETMLRETLGRFGFENVPIESIVVFTNNRIEVQNKCKGIRTCFLGQLCHIIESKTGEKLLSEHEMNNIDHAIDAARYKEAYPFTEYDIPGFKQNFAVLMAKLEGAACEEASEDIKEMMEEESVPEKEYTRNGADEVEISVHPRKIKALARKVFSREGMKKLGNMVAVASITFAVTAVIGSLKGGV